MRLRELDLDSFVDGNGRTNISAGICASLKLVTRVVTLKMKRIRPLTGEAIFQIGASLPELRSLTLHEMVLIYSFCFCSLVFYVEVVL